MTICFDMHYLSTATCPVNNFYLLMSDKSITYMLLIQLVLGCKGTKLMLQLWGNNTFCFCFNAFNEFKIPVHCIEWTNF